jgi:hypothetical protein
MDNISFVVLLHSECFMLYTHVLVKYNSSIISKRSYNVRRAMGLIGRVNLTII